MSKLDMHISLIQQYLWQVPSFCRPNHSSHCSKHTGPAAGTSATQTKQL